MLSSTQAIQLLRRTDTPQQDAPTRPRTERIGNRPNLRQLISQALALTPGNYSGIWLPKSGGHYLWVNANWHSFKAKWQELAATGLKLVDIEVSSGGSAATSAAEMPSTAGFGGGDLPDAPETVGSTDGFGGGDLPGAPNAVAEADGSGGGDLSATVGQAGFGGGGDGAPDAVGDGFGGGDGDDLSASGDVAAAVIDGFGGGDVLSTPELVVTVGDLLRYAGLFPIAYFLETAAQRQ